MNNTLGFYVFSEAAARFCQASPGVGETSDPGGGAYVALQTSPSGPWDFSQAITLADLAAHPLQVVFALLG